MSGATAARDGYTPERATTGPERARWPQHGVSFSMNGSDPCASFAPFATLKYVLVKMDRECHNSPAVEREKKACKWDQPVGENRFARSLERTGSVSRCRDDVDGANGGSKAKKGESRRREGEGRGPGWRRGYRKLREWSLGYRGRPARRRREWDERSGWPAKKQKARMEKKIRACWGGCGMNN